MDDTRYKRRQAVLQAEIDAKKQQHAAKGLTDPAVNCVGGIGVQDQKKAKAERDAYEQARSKWPASMFVWTIKPLDPTTGNADELKQMLGDIERQMQDACGIPKPPIGLRPRKIVDGMRRQEIEEAIERYKAAGTPVPVEWELELAELQASDNLRQFIHHALRSGSPLMALYNRRGKRVTPHLMQRAAHAIRDDEGLRGQEIEAVWLDESAAIESEYLNLRRRKSPWTAL